MHRLRKHALAPVFIAVLLTLSAGCFLRDRKGVASKPSGAEAVEKAFNEQNIKVHQIETEPCFKQDYYNKVMVKHKWEPSKLFKINRLCSKLI